MPCECYQEQFDAYLEGWLPEAERVLLEAHLPECPVCRAELERSKRLAALLDQAAEIQPPSDLSDSIMERIETPWYGRWFPLPPRFVWAPMTVLLLVMAGWLIHGPLTPQEPTDEEVAQALAEVRYALGVVHYAADRTGSTLAKVQERIQPPDEVREQVASAGQATESGISRGLSLALIPLSRITSFGWRNSP